MRALDNALIEWRFIAAPRTASGGVIYLAIDKRTLDSVGTWPWPRSIYSDVIEKLSHVGVDDIFIDVDFSTPSSPDEDKRLAEALAGAGSSVILPAFKQNLAADANSTTIVTQPLPALAENAWLAFANVALDSDGSVRRFALGDVLDGQLTQSAAAVLARAQASYGSKLIDYSILPSTVPTISLSDFLNHDFDATSLKGRSVVIGAYATELKDIFPVPVYGQLTGPMLHILAAETILQNRLLEEYDQTPLELAFAAAVIAAAFGARALPTGVPFLSTAAVIAVGEALFFLLQKDHGLVIYTATGWIVLLLGLVLTLTEKVDFSHFLAELAGAEQRNIRRLFRKVVADSTDAVLAFDHHLRIFEENDAAQLLLGSSKTSYRGKSLVEVIPASLYNLVVDLTAEHAKEPDFIRASTTRFSVSVEGVVRHLEAAITISPMERPEETGGRLETSFIGSLMIRDITARQLYEERLQYLSQYDDLTGLMNRRTFVERLSSFNEPVHVLAIGLHRFSSINATMGRTIGDDLLRAVARRLNGAEAIACAGRLGGDVFAVAVPQPTLVDQGECAQFVLGLFNDPLELAQQRIHISARVGVYTIKTLGEDADGWMEKAEHALDDAKTIAGAGWRPYEPRAALKQHRSRELEQAMRDSLTGNEFFLLYQPQVELRTGRLKGAEALLRWRHPEFGMISPAMFIPVAEANGFVCDLGRWVLIEACREAAQWPDNLTVAVNVAPIQLAKGDLLADVKNALDQSGLPASRLHLEITESAFVEQSGLATSVIGELRDMGIAIALDDFGTGYSSLSYMAGFPLDKLKIDQSFVRKIAKDQQSLAIVQTVKALAQGLGLTVIAEGIETQVEWQMLASMGCEEGQGYFFGKPQTSEDLLALHAKAPWSSAA